MSSRGDIGLWLTNSISTIEIMGLIGEKCQSCKEAAEAEDGGGIAGAWWRAWAYVSVQGFEWVW